MRVVEGALGDGNAYIEVQGKHRVWISDYSSVSRRALSLLSARQKEYVSNNSPFELAGGGEGLYADKPFLYAFASILWISSTSSSESTTSDAFRFKRPCSKHCAISVVRCCTRPSIPVKNERWAYRLGLRYCLSVLIGREHVHIHRITRRRCVLITTPS